MPKHPSNTSRHPSAIYYLIISFSLVTLAFGTVNSVLILYLTQKLNFPSKPAYELFAAFNSIVFTLPIICGYLGEKFGYKQTTIVGLILGIAGAVVLSIPHKIELLIGLALMATCVATTTTTCACLVDLSYAKDDTRRESGFTLYYLLFNIGFLIASFVGGYVSKYFGYNTAFLVAACSLLVSLATFLVNRKLIQPFPGRSMDPQVSYGSHTIYTILLSSSIAISAFTMILFKYVELNNILLWTLIIVTSLSIVFIAFRMKDKLSRFKLLAFLLLCIIAIAFWALYMLEPSLLTIFIEHNVDRVIYGQTIPAATYYGLDSFFVITLGLIFTWLWNFLENKGKDLSLPTKFAASLLSMGLGFWIFVLGIHYSGADYLVNSTWIVIGYCLLTIAELFISPIGLSMVGRLSPAGKEGLLMGVWQLFIGFSAVISGYLANLAATPDKPLPAAQTNPIYSHAFFMIGLFTVTCGVIAVILIPFIKRLIADKNAF